MAISRSREATSPSCRLQWRYDTALQFVGITRRVALICLSISIPLGAAATVVASWTLLRRNGLKLVRR